MAIMKLHLFGYHYHYYSRTLGTAQELFGTFAAENIISLRTVGPKFLTVRKTQFCWEL